METPVTVGRGASSDPSLHISNHQTSRQTCARSNLSSNFKDESVTIPLCLAPLVCVNYLPPSTIPQADFLPN